MLEATAIIVNFRSETHVADLLTHVSGQPDECPAQIVVVDNSPAGGLEGRPELAGAAVSYLAMEHNAGFAAAVNRGLREARLRFVILLNPDARPEPGCLSGLLRELESVREAAIAGPRLVPFHVGDAEIPSATLTEPNLTTLLLEFTAAHRLVPGARDWLRRNYFADPTRSDAPVAVAMVQGACLAFFRSWSERAGDFDASRFFLYWEETDFCRRVRAQGGKVIYCPQLRCRHLGGASRVNDAEASRHYWRSFYAYLEKHRGRTYAHCVRWLLVAGISGEYLILRVLDWWRRGTDTRLKADAESMRLRLRAQLTRQHR